MFHRVVKSDGRCKDWPVWPISPPERLSRCRDPRDHSAGVLFLHDTNSHHTHYRKVELRSTESRSQGGFSVPTEPLPRIDPSSDQSCTPLRARPPALPLLRVIGPLFPSWIRAPYPPPPVTDPSLVPGRFASRQGGRSGRRDSHSFISSHSTAHSSHSLHWPDAPFTTAATAATIITGYCSPTIDNSSTAVLQPRRRIISASVHLTPADQTRLAGAVQVLRTQPNPHLHHLTARLFVSVPSSLLQPTLRKPIHRDPAPTAQRRGDSSDAFFPLSHAAALLLNATDIRSPPSSPCWQQGSAAQVAGLPNRPSRSDPPSDVSFSCLSPSRQRRDRCLAEHSECHPPSSTQAQSIPSRARTDLRKRRPRCPDLIHSF